MIDSHNHIHFREFRKDLPEVMERAAAGGIRAMLAVGIDPKDSAAALNVACAYQGVYVSIGIHPQNGGRYTKADVLGLKGMYKKEYVVAVGETGFDLYRSPDSFDAQRDLFLAHIELARELKLPLVIHDRSAHEQTMSLLDETDAWGIGGVFHCFSGDTALARTVVSKGFLVSIPGVVTFKNAATLREVVRTIPLEHLLVETDAPYLTPEPYRGHRNEPSYTTKTVEQIARIKAVEPETVARKTTENFCGLFLQGKQVSPLICP